MNEQERNTYEKLINSPANKHGEIVSVVIGSPVISEGLSFFNVRQVHILEPEWNLAITL